MPDNDGFVDLLDRPEIRTIRKPESIVERRNGASDDAGGYDLTNPNLHHGAEDIYRPVQSSEPLRSSPSIEAGASSATVSESFQLHAGDSGATATATAIANQSAYEGQTFSLDVSSHFVAPAAGDTLTFSGSLPTGLSIDAHTGVISGVPTQGDLGNNPITVTAIDAHGMAISESFHLEVGDTNHTFFINSHNGDASINGSSSWTDTVDLHNVGHNASFNIVELAADGHAVQSWTGLVVSGAAQSDHNLTLTQGDHATITINHTDGSAIDHIVLQNIDHIRY